MFILRKITGNGLEINFALGKAYTLIHKERNPHEFKELSQALFKVDEPDQVYGYVKGDDDHPQMLYEKQWNYIVTEGGRTFANVSQRT